MIPAAVRGGAAARILLSFGGDAEALSPAEVRADLAAAAAAVVEGYADSNTSLGVG